MTHLSLFSGIGGIDLAAEWAGFRTVAFVERDPFCQKVLKKHWPEVPIYDDITTFDAKPFRGVDLVSGGFPCQDISAAGKQAGLKGERSGLWFEMLRVIAQARPAWIVAENVANLVSMGIDACLLGLESEGYTTRAVVLPASAVGAVHKRERCFVIARNSDSKRFKEFDNREPAGTRHVDGRPLGNSASIPGLETGAESSTFGGERDTRKDTGCRHWLPISTGDWRTWSVKPVIRRSDGGIPNRMDRLRALGNAVVPQQVYPILKAIAMEAR